MASGIETPIATTIGIAPVKSHQLEEGDFFDSVRDRELLGDETFILRGSRKLRSYPLPPGPLASTGVVPELRVGYPRAKETDWSKEALGIRETVDC